MVFIPDTYTKAPVAPFSEGADGKTWILAVAHAALTAKTPYSVIMDEYGSVTAALSDVARYMYIGVPDQDYASGALARLQIGGLCEDMITPSISGVVGYALRIFDGAAALVSEDYSGTAGQFASIVTETTTSTTQDVQLCGHLVLTVT